MSLEPTKFTIWGAQVFFVGSDTFVEEWKTGIRNVRMSLSTGNGFSKFAESLANAFSSVERFESSIKFVLVEENEGGLPTVSAWPALRKVQGPHLGIEVCDKIRNIEHGDTNVISLCPICQSFVMVPEDKQRIHVCVKYDQEATP